MKAESEYFPNAKEIAFFGAFLSICFGFNSIDKKLFSKAYFIFQIKPNEKAPNSYCTYFIFVKYTFSSLTGEKSNVVATLDHF